MTDPAFPARPIRGPWPQPHPVRGFYGPGTRMWRINREAVLLGAGPAALLLQVAHPLVAEGVAAHSRVADDPFGRLRRTLMTTLDMVFGDGPTAERAIRRLNGVHGSVRGPVMDAAARTATGADHYRAMDPALLLWVQATLIWSSVEAYTRWVGPLSAADREAFWREARAVGVRMGIPLAVSPPDWAAFLAYWSRMVAEGSELQVTDTARRLSPLILRPALPLAPAPLVDLLALPGLALLPDRIRDAYAIPWGPRRAATAAWLGRGVRAWTAAVPADWRAMPPARRAARRVHAASGATSRPG